MFLYSLSTLPQISTSFFYSSNKYSNKNKVMMKRRFYLLNHAKEILQTYYGYDEFRNGQSTIIEQVLSGKDTVAIMPTGGGKSICYQVPALMLPGITIVISPLISLMKDQVDALNNAGIPATFINSSISGSEMYERIQAIEAGKYKLLYLAPERLEAPSFVELIKKMNVSLIAIDEAHCISQWGHDFRPSYLSIKSLLMGFNQSLLFGFNSYSNTKC